MIDKQIDVLVVGGGLIGAAFLMALQGLGYSTLLVEARPFSDKIKPDFDARSLALSPASQRILGMLGIWDYLKDEATPIEMIHVSEQHRFGMARIHGKKDAPLGYVLELQAINRAIYQIVPPHQIKAPALVKAFDKDQGIVTLEDGQRIKAQLIVAADGSDSLMRQLCQLPTQEKQYQQQAIVANIGLNQSHECKAYERFTPNGPIALLPLTANRMALVWANSSEKTEELMACSDELFLKALQQAFGYRLGRFVKSGTRSVFSLKQVLMPQQIQWPVVFVGNAAHTLHPVAGQGFNLGLRDVAALAQCIAQYGLNPQMLKHYMDSRRHDQKAITGLTDGLIHLFTSRLPGLGFARNVGLIALDRVPILKNLLARYARGFGGVIPDLVCEMALTAQRGVDEPIL